MNELQNKILAFAYNSEYYSYTIVWFGDIDYNERRGYYIDTICFDESGGEIIEKRFYENNIDMDDVVEVDKQYYPVPEYELMKRLFEYEYI